MPARKIDRNTIRDLINDGWTHKQIAKHLNCSEYTVIRARKELGLPPGNNPLTPERRARIQEMLNDGWSWKEIERTEGANWDTMARHFPGTQWTRKQAVEQSTIIRHAANGPNWRRHPRKAA